jgi:hypothetical protein
VPDDASTTLELYKLAVEMADRTSARRAGTNSFFLTLNTVFAAFMGIVSSARKPPPHGSLPSFDSFGLVVTAIAGVVLSLAWWALLRYYRRLNGAKFVVINEIEKCLPIHPYTQEWELLHPAELPISDVNENQKLTLRQRLRRRTKHREASVVEQVVPFAFLAIYIVLGARALIA